MQQYDAHYSADASALRTRVVLVCAGIHMTSSCHAAISAAENERRFLVPLEMERQGRLALVYVLAIFATSARNAVRAARCSGRAAVITIRN